MRAPFLFRFASSHFLRQMIVCALVVALPINSFSNLLTRVLGASHFHHAAWSSPEADATPSSWQPEAILHALVGDEAMALIAAFHVREQTLHPPAQFAPHVHSHGHGLFERHTHDPLDGSVIVIGTKESGQDATGSLAGIDVGSQALPPEMAVAPVTMLSSLGQAWHGGRHEPWRSHVNAPLERPPRA